MNARGSHAEPIHIRAGAVMLEADLTIPQWPLGLVLFAHGSGSSRHSSRNRAVASVLNRGRLATLLLDLLTVDEEAVDERTRRFRFDIPLLAERLEDAILWARERPHTRPLKIGLFGASTGAAAALLAAAALPQHVSAVVSRGGRPDLAMDALPLVQAPTLLIVGSLDQAVIGMNQRALAQLRCEKRLEIIPGATHLFEEPGALDQVAHLAHTWFSAHLYAAAGGH